jgi:predicted transcriptional regulator of viral defense system
MRNDYLNSKNLTSLTSNLPYFETRDFLAFKDSNYAKIMVSRYAKKGEIYRLKKGLYVSREYLDHIGTDKQLYAEFVANIQYKPSYLSLEYVLAENGIITESVRNFTSVSLLKTNKFSNLLGNFLYYKVKEALFLGFDVLNEGGFRILKARKSKALFDYLYLRKNIIVNEDSFSELRLNMENVSRKDIKELEGYVNIEGSKKMKDIFNYVKKWNY